MTLGDLIAQLEAAPQERVLRVGFSAPHSYRGYYEQLAFEPRQNVMVSSMLADAKDALGRTYQGYKGGDYKMHSYTDVWMAEHGCCGDALSWLLIHYMLNDFDPLAQRSATAHGEQKRDGGGT